MHNHAAMQSGAMGIVGHVVANAFNPQHLSGQQKKTRR
jgi:hypothetical protein